MLKPKSEYLRRLWLQDVALARANYFYGSLEMLIFYISHFAGLESYLLGSWRLSLFWYCYRSLNCGSILLIYTMIIDGILFDYWLITVVIIDWNRGKIIMRGSAWRMTVTSKYNDYS